MATKVDAYKKEVKELIAQKAALKEEISEAKNLVAARVDNAGKKIRKFVKGYAKILAESPLEDGNKSIYFNLESMGIPLAMHVNIWNDKTNASVEIYNSQYPSSYKFACSFPLNSKAEDIDIEGNINQSNISILELAFEHKADLEKAMKDDIITCVKRELAQLREKLNKVKDY